MQRPWNRLHFAVFACACLMGGGSFASAGPGTTLGLVWEPSSQPGVAGYRVHYGEVSRHYTQKLDARNSTLVDVPNLAPGTTYFFAVTAYNGHDVESLPSDEISVTTPGATPGLYTGLFAVPDGFSPGQAGSYRLQLSAGGAYSGQLQIGMKRVGFSGRLDNQNRVVATLRRPGANPLTLQLNLGSGVDAGSAAGQVTDGFWAATAAGYRAPYDARHSPAPCAGLYTLVLPGLSTPGASAGDGFGSVRVTSAGAVRVVGTLADGSKFAQSAALMVGNAWPLFVPSSAGQGLLAGWLNFQTDTNSDIGGALTWIKPADPKSAYESGGVTNVNEVLGSAYLANPHAIALFLQGSNFEAIFSGSDLLNGFTISCVMRSASQAVGSGANDLAMSFSPTTGTFRGKVTDPASGSEYGFAGAVLQKLNTGSGFVLVPGHSSRVVLSP